MLDFANRLDRLNSRIDDAGAVLKKRGQVAARQITVLVDGGGQHVPPMLAIPGGIIFAAAAQK